MMSISKPWGPWKPTPFNPYPGGVGTLAVHQRPGTGKPVPAFPSAAVAAEPNASSLREGPIDDFLAGFLDGLQG
jgi:hypothetical protein